MNTKNTTSNIVPFRRWVIDCDQIKAYVLLAPDGKWHGKCFCCLSFDGLCFEGDILRMIYPTRQRAIASVQFTVRGLFENPELGSLLKIPTKEP
ncbi:hypothetical protein HUN01_30540 [Nostoc edaphicum CCNP1411]|uniref:Uncharacterized protein n=1 Tax=Nostoc edaphicum CCNP1411 TaxID=1472755 RepID=A0A7D7QNJ0_9NOSO|nr:hypothetical protein [Nostoc edaphicum]QMS91724.1 hypothetical protein HUN01_30540 [Nostoc edaphicum CCNP1411]